VKAALVERWLSPVAEHNGEYQAFSFKDPDGFRVLVSNATKAMRRKTAATGALKAAAPFKPTGWKTVFVDHLSFEVADYQRSVAFYEALLGWQVRREIVPPAWPDSPRSSTVRIGDIAGAIIRNGRGTASGPVTATIGHISFGIDPWRRGVRALSNVMWRATSTGHAPRDDIAGGLEGSTFDAMGWDRRSRPDDVEAAAPARNAFSGSVWAADRARQVARDESDANQHRDNRTERCGIVDPDPEHETLEAPSSDQRRRKSNRNADRDDNEAMSQEQSNDLAARRAKCHSNTDFPATLSDALRDHSINADRGKKKCNTAETQPSRRGDGWTPRSSPARLFDR
jgi:catechol 2,3-dioxygenase-like lactoylglutathione lyase family enzyme